MFFFTHTCTKVPFPCICLTNIWGTLTKVDLRKNVSIVSKVSAEVVGPNHLSIPYNYEIWDDKNNFPRLRVCNGKQHTSRTKVFIKLFQNQFPSYLSLSDFPDNFSWTRSYLNRMKDNSFGKTNIEVFSFKKKKNSTTSSIFPENFIEIHQLSQKISNFTSSILIRF